MGVGFEQLAQRRVGCCGLMGVDNLVLGVAIN
jgi:hypothetical protein